MTRTETIDFERTRAALARELCARRDSEGVWRGELSASALSTSTAVTTFRLAMEAGIAEPEDAVRVRRGLRWLASTQNEDGGFGDTCESPSNVSTTTLAWATMRGDESSVESFRRAERYLLERIPTLSPRAIADAITTAYGDDRTFSVPILTMCALSGAFGNGDDAWAPIPALPFELAAMPQALFHRLGLPVVSYALPALIAIGQTIHHHRPTRFAPLRWIRNRARERTLRTLDRIQPTNGGFLEATPLTSFVSMSLIGMGRGTHRVVDQGLCFLRSSERDEGDLGASWPIDTNLATWLTSLAVDALAAGAGFEKELDPAAGGRIAQWLRHQQYTETHAYTRAAPGGWAWTDLPGGVPDADDTPAALLALHHLGAYDLPAIEAGVLWLVELQNADGGIPTFCRGWGKLPFDRSSPDLTAHTLRAWHAWRDELSSELRARVATCTERAQRFLVQEQRDDGAWVPLWFGNQHEERLENPLYGTSRVVKAAAVEGNATWTEAIARGRLWLLQAQHADGGFGGAPGLPPTVEETGLALDALGALVEAHGPSGALHEAIARAASWLAEHTADPGRLEAAPIGLYFAKLWYSEELYPLVFATAGMQRAASILKNVPAE